MRLYLARKLARQIGGDLILCNENFDFKSEIAIQDSQKANIFYLKIPIKKFHR